MVEDLSDVVEELGTGNYVVTRRPPAVFVAGENVEAVAAEPWEEDTDYQTGARVSWSGDVYEATVPGTSSHAQPPSGRGLPAIIDGTEVWKWVAPAAELLTVSASEQPISGRELDRLPELLRTREVKLFITATELRLCTATGEGDLVTIGSDVWEVTQVQDWRGLIGVTRALIARRGR